jgi:hypothetical protein
VIKLHGSIDWHLGEDDRVWRVRDGDLYPKKISRVLIYPQSTKYLATQRDPFAAQFDLFRRALGAREENVLATCGYSFGDEHINQEIELALQRLRTKQQFSPLRRKSIRLSNDGEPDCGANESMSSPRMAFMSVLMAHTQLPLQVGNAIGGRLMASPKCSTAERRHAHYEYV